MPCNWKNGILREVFRDKFFTNICPIIMSQEAKRSLLSEESYDSHCDAIDPRCPLKWF